MKLSLRLFLLSLAAMATLAAISLFGLDAFTQKSFNDYLRAAEIEAGANLVKRLEDNYRSTGSWQDVVTHPRRWRELHLSPPDKLPGRGPSAGFPPPGDATRGRPGPDQQNPGFTQRGTQYFLADRDGTLLGNVPRPPINKDWTRLPINVDGTRVGWILKEPTPRADNSLDRQFGKRQQRALVLVILTSLILATAFAWLVSQLILGPVKLLTDSTRALARGEGGGKLDIQRGDELGELASSFNAMVEQLDKEHEKEQQWLADVAHELRTPLAVLRGEIDALIDGIRQPGPETLQSLQDEVSHLTRLVGDLHQLSSLEAGSPRLNREHTDLAPWLDTLAERFDSDFQQKALKLGTELDPTLSASIDPHLFLQVMDNLFQNTLNYAVPGPVKLSLYKEAGSVVIGLEDSGPGVPAHSLPKLFDRLYRVDAARNRSSGGSGLGLAIARSIVEAHHGSIAAMPSPLGGVKIEIRLPTTTTQEASTA